MYKVQQITEICSESHCSLKCHSCKNTCLHTFSYTCIDSLMHGTICKHIHLVSMARAEVGNSHLESSAFPTSISELQDLPDPDYSNEVKELVSEIKSSTMPCNVGDVKARVKGKMLQLLTEVEHCTHKEALLELDRGLSAKQFLFDSMMKQPTAATLVLKENGPANKNLDRQRRFFSTKRKRKRQENIRYSKPTHEEKENLFKTTIGVLLLFMVSFS